MWNAAIPVAPSAVINRHSRRSTGRAAHVLCQTKGAMMASASSQRRKLSVTGSIAPRSARPATKLRDQNSAAKGRANAGDRSAARVVVTLISDDVRVSDDVRAAAVAVMLHRLCAWKRDPVSA